MLFYLSVAGIALLAWLVYALFIPSVVLNITVFGIFSAVIIFIGIHRGYIRGRLKEIIFAACLIFLYGFRGLVRNVMVFIYNQLYALVATALNRGAPRADIEKGFWKPTETINSVMEIVFFFIGAIIAYAITSGLWDTKPKKDIFGAALGGLSIALFLTYGFNLLSPFLKNLYNYNILEGASIKLPTLRLPDIRFNKPTTSTSPLSGWETWLPIAMLGVVTVYLIFFVFLNPPTRTNAKTNKTGPDVLFIVGIAALIGLAWLLTIGPTLKLF